jgi:hypothetical protein
LLTESVVFYFAKSAREFDTLAVQARERLNLLYFLTNSPLIRTGASCAVAPDAKPIEDHSQTPFTVMPARGAPRRVAARRAAAAVIAAIGLAGLAALTWSYIARSAQAEQTKANVEGAAKLNAHRRRRTDHHSRSAWAS